MSERRMPKLDGPYVEKEWADYLGVSEDQLKIIVSDLDRQLLYGGKPMIFEEEKPEMQSVVEELLSLTALDEPTPQQVARLKELDEIVEEDNQKEGRS